MENGSMVFPTQSGTAIFIDKLHCTGEEHDITECRAYRLKERCDSTYGPAAAFCGPAPTTMGSTTLSSTSDVTTTISTTTTESTVTTPLPIINGAATTSSVIEDVTTTVTSTNSVPPTGTEGKMSSDATEISEAEGDSTLVLMSDLTTAGTEDTGISVRSGTVSTFSGTEEIKPLSTTNGIETTGNAVNGITEETTSIVDVSNFPHNRGTTQLYPMKNFATITGSTGLKGIRSNDVTGGTGSKGNGSFDNSQVNASSTIGNTNTESIGITRINSMDDAVTLHTGTKRKTGLPSGNDVAASSNTATESVTVIFTDDAPSLGTGANGNTKLHSKNYVDPPSTGSWEPTTSASRNDVSHFTGGKGTTKGLPSYKYISTPTDESKGTTARKFLPATNYVSTIVNNWSKGLAALARTEDEDTPGTSSKTNSFSLQPNDKMGSDSKSPLSPTMQLNSESGNDLVPGVIINTPTYSMDAEASDTVSITKMSISTDSQVWTVIYKTSVQTNIVTEVVVVPTTGPDRLTPDPTSMTIPDEIMTSIGKTPYLDFIVATEGQFSRGIANSGGQNKSFYNEGKYVTSDIDGKIQNQASPDDRKQYGNISGNRQNCWTIVKYRWHPGGICTE
ncbi:mucin-22-like [Lytechinus pictus]|uniref:mucin-22-like n=1 Tax=Lytechinus pictus TaxID=7653 RepID=UPI0030BA25F5